jgi:hypothetical protein
MRRNSEIPAILTRVADTMRKIQLKSIRFFPGFALFAVFFKNFQKIRRKTVTPQDYSGLYIMERISELYWLGRVTPAALSFIHQPFLKGS